MDLGIHRKKDFEKQRLQYQLKTMERQEQQLHKKMKNALKNWCDIPVYPSKSTIIKILPKKQLIIFNNVIIWYRSLFLVF